MLTLKQHKCPVVSIKLPVAHPLDTTSLSWSRNQHYLFSALLSIINKQERNLLSSDDLNGVRGSVLNKYGSLAQR